MGEIGITEPKEASHGMHGSSDIKGLPGDSPERYQGWEVLNHMRTWRSREDAEAYARLPLEVKRAVSDEDMGFNVDVTVYLSPEGKVRAYCHACGSEYCVHAWEALQGALKSVALSVLEMECGDFIEAIKLLKLLPPEEKERVLKYRGIDTGDLSDYLGEMLGEVQEALKERHGKAIKDLTFYP